MTPRGEERGSAQEGPGGSLFIDVSLGQVRAASMIVITHVTNG